MPYLKFLTSDGVWVELAGNKAEDFAKAFTTNGKILHKELALAWVTALFIRRDAKVVIQKIDRGDLPESGREKALDDLDDAIDEEDEAEEAYQNACKGLKVDSSKTDNTSTQAEEKKEESKNDAGNPYGAVVKRNVVSEDMF